MPRYYKYELDWGNGKTEIVEGPTPQDAMMLAGYGGGAARALHGWHKLTAKELRVKAEASRLQGAGTRA